MNRQRVRINEAQLKQIVTESVKKVLNELDWKTYANAAMKARQKADSIADDGDASDDSIKSYTKYSDMARNFDKASADALNHKFGGNHSVSTDNPRQEIRNTNYNSEWSWRRDVNTRPFKGHEEEWPPYSHNPNNFDGSEEISDFVKGNYEYIKGKGWVRKATN